MSNITLKSICAEINIEPKAARRILRKKFLTLKAQNEGKVKWYWSSKKDVNAITLLLTPAVVK